MRANAAIVAFVSTGRSDRGRDLIAIALLTVSISTIYGARLSRPPLVGEETRWATGAREMLATGEWIVPRQQGRVFAERPPMSMWMMAVAGSLCGDVDAIAIRVPSVIAVVLTSLLIYGYTRAFASTIAATVAAISYATMGQVLQIGRQGESEPLFALLVGASLLVWHLGYLRAWRPLFVWTAGFALAALAALAKGPQAPTYFVAITSMYLAVRRDWRYLISWQFAVGATVFASIVAAWQIPFYLATDWNAVMATWSGLASDRFRLRGALAHAVSYPVETFACLLPWSPMLVAFVRRDTRRLLDDLQPVTTFLITAVLVAYPTVWFAAGARGRYFMPIYPLIAVLVGLQIERCAVAQIGSYPRRAWHQFLLLWGTIIGASGLLIGAVSLMMHDVATRFYQPRWFGLVFAALATNAIIALWISYRRPNEFRALFAVGAIAAIAGIGAAGLLVNVHAARWIDPTRDVAHLRDHLPPGTCLVSFSPVEHRFACYFHEPIAEIDWPRKIDELPPDVEYFCFMRQPGDTADSRAAGRGRSWYETPGTLPFAWQEITSICVERQVYDDSPRTVVLGRVVRPLQRAVSDVTKPQTPTASREGTAHQSRQRK